MFENAKIQGLLNHGMNTKIYLFLDVGIAELDVFTVKNYKILEIFNAINVKMGYCVLVQIALRVVQKENAG